MVYLESPAVGGAAAVVETQCPFCSVQCKMTVAEEEKSIPTVQGQV